MSRLKLITMAALFSLLMVGSASANPWVRYNRGFYGPFGPAVLVPPPVVIAPPPVVVSPYVAPVYVTPAAYAAPVYAAPAPVVYGPPAVAYGVVGPRGRLRPGFTPVGIYVR